MNRDELMWGTGAVCGAAAGVFVSWWDQPWWLGVPLFLAGLAYLFVLARGWLQEWRRR